MKILSAAQIKEADKYTIVHEPVTSINLMERAARACLFRIFQYSESDTTYCIFCGKGNNGGDGLAIARMLADRGLSVNVYIVEHTHPASPDFLENLQRLKDQGMAAIHSIYSKEDIPETGLPKQTVIDALLGIGISKPVDGLLEEVIGHINRSNSFVIAIDIPSGMIPDAKNEGNIMIRAARTLTFQAPKLAFFFTENYAYSGGFEILRIGLDPVFIEGLPCSYFFTDESLIRQLLLHRQPNAHKGNFGHALLICGSMGKTGAAQLAAKACLRSGAGLLTMHIPKCAYAGMQVAIPEAMISLSEEENYISNLPDIAPYSAIGIGCGLGTEKQTQNILKLLIQNSARPLVIDADALNILSENKTWLAFLPKYSILTPHPKEFDRLAGAHTSSFERLKSAKDLAARHSIIVVLKGMHTAVVMPDGNIFFNSTGNPGLAKGGSGDTLTGIITGMLARGYAPNHAAILGVYIHGLAADIALRKSHVESLLASDVIEKIPFAFEAVYLKSSLGK
jgi:NAD(P)H-hydrate epimerase